MSDLTTAHNHPANLLRDFYAPAHATVADAEGYRAAASALNGFETVNKVTFAALDNDALARVRESYADAADADSGSEYRKQALSELAAAVSDLLGLNG